MSWNYRVFKRGDWYFIGEAYYDKDGNFDGGYSESYEHMVSGDTLEELNREVTYIQEALNRPVIELPPEALSNQQKLRSNQPPDAKQAKEEQ